MSHIDLTFRHGFKINLSEHKQKRNEKAIHSAEEFSQTLPYTYQPNREMKSPLKVIDAHFLDEL